MRLVVSVAVAAAISVGLGSGVSAKTLTFCSEAAPEGFDPALYVTPATFDASSQAIYDRLVSFAPGTATIRPGLAQSWEVSEDGLTYTFHLRPDVKFQTTASFTPTRPLTADDVIFSLARQVDPKNRYFDYAGGGWPYYEALSLPALIKALKKVDDLTVAITLTRPDASLPATLAMDFASILSREYADALAKAGTPELLNQAPVGTGPYQLAGYEPDVTIRYTANPDYWGGRQKLDDLVFAIEPNPAERLRKLKAGDCQVMSDPNAATLTAAAADSTLDITEADQLDLAYLAFNVQAPPFGDVRVRKALGMAIDKQAIVDAVYGGMATAAASVVPPSMWSFDAKAVDPGYDVEGAKALLADAGASGLKVTLLTTVASRSYNPDPGRVAAMIAADLTKVGVAVDVVTPETLGEFLAQSSAIDRDGAVLLGWTSDNGDPGSYLSLLLSCAAVGSSNRAQWCYVPFDRLLDQANTTADPAARAALYGQAQEILAVHQPLTAIAHSVASVPVAKTVVNFRASPFGLHNFAGVDLKP